MSHDNRINSIENYQFSDLVDVAEFTKLMESFFKATGIPNGVIGEQGEIISEAGWVDACVLFHRVHPESNKQCQASNLELIKQLQKGEVAHSFCKNGLIDYATPIVIEGRRLATLFLGQVLNESPNISFFQEQAEKFDYNKTAYLKAIKDVPIVSKEKMEALMKSMVGMAEMLAISGLAKLRQNVLENDLTQSTEQRIQLEDILELSPVGIGWSNSQTGKIEYINRQFTTLFGYILEDIPDLDTWYHKAFPDETYRNGIMTSQYKPVEQAYLKGDGIPEVEANVTCKDGSVRHVVIRFAWVGEKRLVNFNDMTAHWKSEQRNRAHDEMLEMIAKGMPLPDILHSIVLAIESEEPSSKCSILLLDEEGKHLFNGASLSLPQFYNDAINGIEIGMGVGSCGTAAYLKKRVIVKDIMTHEYWKPYKELAKEANLGACWSEPITASDRNVLGTFAIYHKNPAEPTQVDIERISFAANLAAIAIENRKTHEALKRQANSDYLTGLKNRRAFIEHSKRELSRSHRYGRKVALIMLDIDYFKRINDAYGHNIGDVVLKHIADICLSSMRSIDIIGRIGGEEFAILLPETNALEALEAADRLRIAIATTEVTTSKVKHLKFTASFGVVANDQEDITLDELLNQADIALYQAKASGRNCVSLAKKST